MQRRTFLKNTLFTSAGMILLPPFVKGERYGYLPASELDTNFLNPPSSARPWCFWMWMNGNITKKGITLDLEAMHRMGIGGCINFNSAVGIPRGAVEYASDEWMELTAHAAREAGRLGLEMTLHNSPGYSGAGGPWITPEMSMQQLVWTETLVQGGNVEIVLSKPYTKMDYYKDALVIAYPSLACEKALMKDKLLKAFVNGKEIDKNILIDGNPETKIRLGTGDMNSNSSQNANSHNIETGTAQSTIAENTKRAKEAVLLLQFSEPFEARAISLQRKPEIPHDLFDGPRDHPPVFNLEYSVNGKDFTSIGMLRPPELREMDTPASLSFTPVTGLYFQLTATSDSWVSTVELHNGPRLAGWPGKTSYTHGDSGGTTPMLTKAEIIDASQVLDISGKMDSSGKLQWKAPEGQQTILRIGHTTTGEENAAHPDSGKGLELDKFRKKALDLHFEKFLDRFLSRIHSEIGKGFKGITTDSWEAGKQNWTQGFPQLFKEKADYDIIKWVPALTGRIVNSIDDTERFLWDVRKVQSSLLSDNFYGHFAEQCHKRGLSFSAEPYGDGNLDSLKIGQHLDVPMSEFWTRYIYGSDLYSKQATSIAHIYGKPIVAAEAFTAMPATAKWTDYPYSLKAEGDYFFSLGVNRFTFHTFVHQPYTTGKPGMTMGPFGMHIDRNNTWTEQAYGWTAYIQRTQYLLQQGLFVADICYFKGDTPESGVPNIYTWLPNGYKGDVIGADALHNRFKIRENKIVLPDGMSYRVCVMAPLQVIELSTLKKLAQLVNEGMTLIVSSKPDKALGHAYRNEDIQNLAAELYGGLDGRNVKERSYGKGKVLWQSDFSLLLSALSIAPDFTYTSYNSDAAIHYIHKQTDEAHYYFISNHKRKEEAIIATFRLTGWQPEIWNSESGEIYDCIVFDEEGGSTRVPLTLSPAGSVFIIFRKKGKSAYNSLRKDDQVLYTAKPFLTTDKRIHNNVKNNFTITLWAKPDTFAHSGRSMLFHAPEGEVVYGAGHAAAALGAGQNGVRLYERAKGSAKEVLFADQSLKGWTHIALVYKDAQPYLFINGKLSVVGKTSQAVIHPGLGTPPAEEQYNAYFEGNFTRPQLIDKALSAEEIRVEFLTGLPPLPLPVGALVKGKKGKITVIAWTNGSYALEGNAGNKNFVIAGCGRQSVSGSWMVKFPAGSGAPAQIVLPQLISLHQHQNDGVKFFSGTAVYSKVLSLRPAWLAPDKKIQLHLGRVEVIAEVKINGKKAGIVWKEPYLLEITPFVKAGANLLEIAVTNLWPNRLIGDEALPKENDYTKDNNITKLPEWYKKNGAKPGQRITFSVWHTYDKDGPLLSSGLLGPVTVLVAVEKEVN